MVETPDKRSDSETLLHSACEVRPILLDGLEEGLAFVS